MKRGRQGASDVFQSKNYNVGDENARLLALVRDLRAQLSAERKLRHRLKMKVLAVLREENLTKSVAPKAIAMPPPQ
jgi:hypothetical protein